jgi:hypothetical protein
MINNGTISISFSAGSGKGAALKWTIADDVWGMISVDEEVGIGRFLLNLCDEILQGLVRIGYGCKVVPRQLRIDSIESGTVREMLDIEGLMARHGYDRGENGDVSGRCLDSACLSAAWSSARMSTSTSVAG